MTLQYSGGPSTGPAPRTTGGAVRLRAAVPADAEACGRIIHDAFLGIGSAHGFPPDFPSPAAAIQLATAFIADASIFGVVAEAEGRIVGSNFLSEGDMVRSVGPITVDPAWQGGSIGRRLMEAVLDRAGRNARVRLVQDAFNTRSVALYASLGLEVTEPLLLMEGIPRGTPSADAVVRPLQESDLPACDALCMAVHGVTRTHELRDALRALSPLAVERGGRVAGYLTAPGFWVANHGVAETEADMVALLAGAARARSGPVTLLLPTRQAGLFRWCLEAGMRVVKPMTLMVRGDYREPRGCWFPSVFY
jgi:GNAT superfamily N-acetyltransferase